MRKNEDIFTKLRRFFSRKREVEFAYLFGSLAKGKNNKLSDIDIAVYVDENIVNKKSYSFGYEASLIADLMDELHTNDIDVVLLNRATPLLAHRVIRDGIVLCSKNDPKRINFQVHSLQQYIDTEKIRHIKEKYLRERLL